MPDRRSLLLTSLAAAAGSSPVLAQFRVEISGVGATRIPVAIGRFKNEEVAGQTVGAIFKTDLERSGRFRIVDVPSPLDETSPFVMTEWRSRAADALAAGSVTRLADGRIDLRYKLWDVVKGSDLGGQSYAVVPADARLASHRIADEIYEKLTGERGVFSTRIAYVTKAGWRHTLRVTDADGEGGQVALTSPEPIISPAWSPDGRELAYVSFETQKAVVWCTTYPPACAVPSPTSAAQQRAGVDRRWSQHRRHAEPDRRLADFSHSARRWYAATPHYQPGHRHRTGVFARRQIALFCE